MTEHGLRKVESAKADGRCDSAYQSGKNMKIPDDLLTAIEAKPEALTMLGKLSAKNRFALAFRMHNVRTKAGRRNKIGAFVGMMERGEPIYPRGGSKRWTSRWFLLGHWRGVYNGNLHVRQKNRICSSGREPFLGRAHEPLSTVGCPLPPGPVRPHCGRDTNWHPGRRKFGVDDLGL